MGFEDTESSRIRGCLDNLNTIIQLSVFSMFHPESTYTNFFLFAEDLLPLQLLWVWKMRLIERQERHDVKIRME